MNIKKKSVIAALLACFLAPSMVNAETFNQNIVAIFGSGNPDTGWTVDTAEGVTLALRAKNRENASTANIQGVYSEPVGFQSPNNNRARWNWEFSINTDPAVLNTYDFYVGIDTDPSVGVSHLVVNANVWNDNSYGTATTLNGQGVEGTMAVLGDTNTIAQQSQNIVFSGGDPNLNATYDYELFMVAKGDGPTGDKIVSVSITVIVGTGGASTQDLLGELATNATNHGDYVKSVSHLTKYLMEGGVINKQERKNILTAAAQSSVGR